MKTNDFINQAITKHIEKVTARINEAATPVVESTVTEQKLPTFNTDAANYAFEQLAEAYGDIDPADWNPEVVAQKLYDKYNGKPLTKDIINHEFKVSFPKWFDRFMWKPDYQDIMYFYKKCSRTPAELRGHPPHVVNHGDVSEPVTQPIKENATGGGTGASSVAVVSSTLGEKGEFSKKDVNKKLGGYSNMLSRGGKVTLPKAKK